MIVSIFINRAMKLMPNEFQKLYRSDYEKTTVILSKNVKTEEQKISSKFIQALKKSAVEFAKTLPGEWSEYSKEEVNKEQFLEKTFINIKLEFEKDAVVFGKEADEDLCEFYRFWDNNQNSELRVVHSNASGRCYIVGTREGVLKTIGEFKKEYQPTNLNAN